MVGKPVTELFRACCARIRLKATALVADQSGAAFVFALVIFLLMLVMGGLAVDVVRMEAQRMKVQNTLDRAVLAAADLDNPLDAEGVVIDYFDKSGLSQFLGQVTVEETLNGKTVTAESDSRVQTMFLKMVGVDSLGAAGSSGAREQVSDIEISLVVDISGSMGWDNADGTATKLATLKTAANTFFDEVADEQSEETGITMVSIIPYNATVNAGEDFLEYFNVTGWHTGSHCIRFRDSDFDDRAITRTQLLERVAHFADDSNSYDQPGWWNYWCEDDPDHAILPFETDIEKMKSHMVSLEAEGMTGIDNGMKWASALLDPEVRSIVNTMVANNERSSLIQNWPTDYGDEDSMKVVVLMTDGENTEQRDIKDIYKSPDGINPAMSPVYFSPSEGATNIDNGWYVDFPNNN